jgi:hypothetical protein
VKRSPKGERRPWDPCLTGEVACGRAEDPQAAGLCFPSLGLCPGRRLSPPPPLRHPRTERSADPRMTRVRVVRGSCSAFPPKRQVDGLALPSPLRLVPPPSLRLALTLRFVILGRSEAETLGSMPERSRPAPVQTSLPSEPDEQFTPVRVGLFDQVYLPLARPARMASRMSKWLSLSATL